MTSITVTEQYRPTASQALGGGNFPIRDHLTIRRLYPVWHGVLACVPCIRLCHGTSKGRGTERLKTRKQGLSQRGNLLRTLVLCFHLSFHNAYVRVQIVAMPSLIPKHPLQKLPSPDRGVSAFVHVSSSTLTPLALQGHLL